MSDITDKKNKLVEFLQAIRSRTPITANADNGMNEQDANSSFSFNYNNNNEDGGSGESSAILDMIEPQGSISKELFDHTITVLAIQNTIDTMTQVQLESTKWPFTDFIKVIKSIICINLNYLH